MEPPALRIRRGRRQDFAAVMRLLMPEEGEADRRTLRRFRHIVADLGADLYVAELAGKVVGVIHASYARQLTGAQRARVEGLAADPDCRQHAVEQRLLEFIVARARGRACADVSCVPTSDDTAAIVRAAGLDPVGTRYSRPLSGEA